MRAARGRPRIFAGLLAAVAALALGAGPGALAAPAAQPPGWHLVRILRHCGNDSLQTVTATGRRDAWAVGQPPWSVACGADVEHWDGSTWRRVPVPRGLQVSDSSAVAASSAADAWIFPQHSGFDGSSYYSYDSALHWDGRAWRASRFARKILVFSAAAFGPADAWAFGAYDRRGALVPYAARYDGRAWRHVTPPVAAEALSAASRTDMWLVGPTVATAGRGVRRQRFLAARWTGRSWQTLRLPRLQMPGTGQVYLETALAMTAGSDDLWWSYYLDGGSRNARQHLLHWHGGRWQAIQMPAGVSPDAITQDGNGGIWVTTGISPEHFYHYHSGRWTRYPVPSPRGYGNVVLGLAWIPGTRSQWGVGEADANTGTHTIATIARYQP